MQNYKTLLKEVLADINKWKDTLHSWIGRFNIVKMTVLSKMNYRFSVIPIKIPVACFAEMEKLILKFIRNYKGHK